MTKTTWTIAAGAMLLWVFGVARSPARAVGQCCGDCSGDGAVTVDEILTAVNHALTSCSDDGICGRASCPAELATCQNELANCRAQPHGQRFPASGQTTAYGPGSDGAVQAGAALSYTDNGDGTITDNNTGLMWEKKVKLDSTPDGTNLHDADDSYPWAGDCEPYDIHSCSAGGTCCQTSADCVSPHTCTIIDGEGTGLTIFGWVAQLNTANFAGHNDWRIPNKKELESILNEGTFSPAVATAFQGASCGGACANIASAACSCTKSGFYWSSTTYQSHPAFAWVMLFDDGNMDFGGKGGGGGYYVRAVRGGL